MKTNKLLMIIVLMAFGLAACSAPASTSVSPAAPDPTQAPAEAMPVASTEAPVVVPTEAPAQAPAESAAVFPTGRYVSVKDKAISIQYNQDGTFGYYIGNIQVVDGTYEVEGNLLSSVNPTETDPKCQGPMTYKWFFDGENLSFAATTEDPCRPRRDASADTYIRDLTFIPEIMIDAADYSYTAPEKVGAGWVRVNLTNSGQESHHVQFFRLNDGVSLDDFEAALKQGEGPAMAMIQQVGGVGAVAPGVSARAVINLPAGEYAILCFIPSPADGLPHHAKGMIKGLTVQESSGGMAAEPEADLAITLQDFTFDMPATLPAGPITIQVTNDGPEPHEWNIMRLEEGKGLQDALQFLTAPDGPPPFVPVGGMNGLDVGKTGYVEFDFQPGNYLAICNIPSPKAEGHPHFTLGMVKQFAVASLEVSSFPTGKFVSVNDDALAHQFNEDGTFAFLVGEIPVVEGTYRTEGDLYMELTNNDSDPTCQEHPTYRWQFDGETLSFSPVSEDTCRGRREAFGDIYTTSD